MLIKGPPMYNSPTLFTEGPSPVTIIRGAAATAQITIIPGHGPVGDKSQLIEFRDMLVTIREKVSALKEQGKSLDEVVAAAPTSAYDAKWGGFVIDAKTFTTLVYAGV
jgi:hypothetical protein